MNHLLNLLPADGWPRFAADAVWQSTLVGLIGLLCIHFVARRPATRALACLVTMLVALAAPLVSAAARLADWGLLQPNAVMEESGAIEQNQELPATRLDGASRGIIEAAPWQGSLGSTSGYSGSRRISTSAFFFWAWCLLSAAMLVRLVASAALVRRLLRSAAAGRNSRVLSSIEAAAQRLKIQAPHVLVSEAVKLPTVLAFGRGVVLLPPDDSVSLTACPNASSEYDRWYAILCHELGHVRRRDGWNRLAAEVATALLPWQPLLWCLRRQFLRHAEEACDDWAVASGADPIEFAAVLTDFIPTVCPLPLGASIMSTDARHRILRLLALRNSPRPRTTRWQLIATTVAACTMVAGIALAQPGALESKEPFDRAVTTPDGKADDADKRNRLKPRNEIAYVLEPPDSVLIEPIRLLPKGPMRVEKLDQLQIDVAGVLEDAPINGVFKVDTDGEISLGPVYGRVEVVGLTV